MQKVNETYILDEGNIDALSEKVHDFLKELEYTEEAVISSRLALETILVEWMEHGAFGKEFTVETKKSFGRWHIYLKLEGNHIDFYSSGQDDDFLNALENNISALFSVTYIDGTNVADIKLPRQQLSSLGQISVAFVLACVFGKLLPLMFSSAALKSFSLDYLTPSFSVIIGALGAVAVFQIFFSVLDTIINMGNIAVFKDLGGKYVRMVMSTTVLTTFVGGIIILLFCPILNEGLTVGNESFKKIYQLFVNIIPSNILKPFADGNMLQVVVMGCFFGTLLLIIESETSRLRGFISELNKLFQFAIVSLSKLMPVFIFLSLLSLFLNDHMNVIIDSWYLFTVHVVCCLAVALTMLAIAAIYTRNNLLLLIKRCLSVLAVGFTTASTIVAVPNIKSVLESYGVSEDISRFNINLGYVFSRHTCCMVTMNIICCYYTILDKHMDIGGFIMLAVISMVLAVVAPSVPGGGAALIANLMAQYGIPMEIVAVVLSLDYFLDMITTGTGCVCMTAEGLILNER